ncbi:class I SAM-dependent methyltransferase [Streptomyces lasiicapitis]|uniref:class I SAM-dependent methyltransferase n=1 Tax=Streptomyces lasiicapitis TaxID=1923961 RepID=UPI0036806247
MRILEVTGDDYRRSFELFLAGTDEKAVINTWLSTLVDQLPSRTVFVDVGAGSGAITAHVGRSFERTIALEPSAHMRRELQKACPGAVIIAEPVDQAELDIEADLALCSHVLYHLPEATWLPTVRRILGWVRQGAELLILLQNPENACMRMVRHFTGARFDLTELATELRENAADLVGVCTIETLAACYRTTSLPDAVDVAEHLLNVSALAQQDPLPTRRALQQYVLKEFALPEGGFRIGQAQDVLRIRRA